MKNTDENMQTGENLSWVSFEAASAEKPFGSAGCPLPLPPFIFPICFPQGKASPAQIIYTSW
jgi:hypothetical protein